MREATKGLRIIRNSKDPHMVPMGEMAESITVNLAAKAPVGATCADGCMCRAGCLCRAGGVYVQGWRHMCKAGLHVQRLTTAKTRHMCTRSQHCNLHELFFLMCMCFH